MPLTCDNCCYYWKEETDRYAMCHFGADDRMPDDLAPCEYDDYYSRFDTDTADEWD